jgi:hypothetical protein
VNGSGVRQQINGSWDYKKLSKDQLRVTLSIDGGPQWNATFRILDHDHIHNLDENYVAVRVVK